MIKNTGTGPCLEPSFHRVRTSTSGPGIYQKGCNHFSFESRISNIYHAWNDGISHRIWLKSLRVGTPSKFCGRVQVWTRRPGLYHGGLPQVCYITAIHKWIIFTPRYVKYQELRAMVSKIGHVSSHDRDCSAGGGCPQHSHCEWGLCACNQGHAGQQRWRAFYNDQHTDRNVFVAFNILTSINLLSMIYPSQNRCQN